ncbi:MAG TPA: HTTM domain-containing protein [Polyangia bacterium]|nr:HTTM domain-containing protein [Polyangia bacterium]
MSRRRKRAAAAAAVRTGLAPAASRPTVPTVETLIPRIRGWLTAPQPIERLALLRIFLPLAILGFLSSRLVHADYWLTAVGFQIPDLGGDWRQPLYLPPAPVWAAWTLAAVITTSGLCLAAGLASQPAAAIFALGVAYVTLADRLEAFTVTKLAPILILALFFAPCGARYGVDGWWRRRRNPGAKIPTHVAGGTIRFFQIFLVTMYSASGIAKARGDWLTKQVLWTHLHDQYQTRVAWLITHLLPGWMWWALQGLVLTFEAGAPIWFALPWTRRPALVVGLGMHAMIGLMFGPVVWFALLMATILLASFLPEPLLLRLWAPLRRWSRPTGPAGVAEERSS